MSVPTPLRRARWLDGPVLVETEVEAASMAWLWVPDNARVEEAPGLRVVAYPPHFEFATAVHSTADAVDEPEAHVARAEQLVRDLGRDRVCWYVGAHTRPAGLEALLLARGAEVVERTDVLAVTLPGPSVAPAPDGLEVVEVTTEQDVRDVYTVEVAAFGVTTPPDDQVAHALGEVETGRERGDLGRVLARLDGRPVGSAGWTLAEHQVLRLWGAGTVPAARGRGVYGALLAERLRIGSDLGARFALTHGRVETSSPILRRAGFTRYGEKRVLALDLTVAGD